MFPYEQPFFNGSRFLSILYGFSEGKGFWKYNVEAIFRLSASIIFMVIECGKIHIQFKCQIMSGIPIGEEQILARICVEIGTICATKNATVPAFLNLREWTMNQASLVWHFLANFCTSTQHFFRLIFSDLRKSTRFPLQIVCNNNAWTIASYSKIAIYQKERHQQVCAFRIQVQVCLRWACARLS